MKNKIIFYLLVFVSMILFFQIINSGRILKKEEALLDEKINSISILKSQKKLLEDRLNEEIQKNVEVKEANSELVREQVISEVSEDLADTEVEKFKTLTSDLEFSNEDTFKEKLNTIKENYFPKVKVEENVSDDETDGSAQDIVTSSSMKHYMTAISRNKARAS